MDLHAAEMRIEALRKEIDRHRVAYHVSDRPEISDEAYDALYAELEMLEHEYPDLVVPESPTHQEGGDPDNAAYTEYGPFYPLDFFIVEAGGRYDFENKFEFVTCPLT